MKVKFPELATRGHHCILALLLFYSCKAPRSTLKCNFLSKNCYFIYFTVFYTLINVHMNCTKDCMPEEDPVDRDVA